MGQAKRRSKKKSEFKLPSFSFNKDELKAKLAPLKAKWQSLPSLHRKALTVLIPVMGILLLLPASEKTSTSVPAEPERRELALNLESNQEVPPPVGQRAEPESPKRAVAAVPKRQPDTEPAEPERKQPATEKSWQKYQVQQGETLAHIFREKSLPLADLYAVAAIEGKDKPLSRIKAGQWLRYKQTAKGGLDALQIESRSGESVMFFRRSDGSFIRSQ
ncbi:hypothetical protein MD588_23915 [Photobacterium sp. SDRW27]|uniref:LysM-like peptidoglycan-binding domain-containing protein n=1 Tax=Photobacterium obscurum TaxID=2829490 RepID=UPI002243CC61|nr:LysM-like peptidoglycan-binding domain-containing protein [Photobacterium obscurum]MCW8331851.1 hypothetical protein [Photobacterium obscurum]